MKMGIQNTYTHIYVFILDRETGRLEDCFFDRLTGKEYYSLRFAEVQKELSGMKG
jgi:hypothetical protein